MVDYIAKTMNRVVISGFGIYSTIGKNIEQVKQSLHSGKSGIGIDPRRKEFGFRSSLTGIIERPNLKGIIPRRMRVGLAEQGEYAYVATMEALENAKIDMDFLEKNEVGILYGNDSSAIPVMDAIDIVREKKDTTLIGSGSIFQSMNSTITMNLSVILKLKGINFTISGACASSSHAIGMAYLMISQGLQEIIICGGGQEPSGGAATVIVESLESALKRGATILGEIKGYGFSSNGDHISVPNVEGPTRSLIRSLESAKMSPSDIDYVNAHATSTPVGDINEAIALATVFGDQGVPVSSTKSMTGHEMWMGGASEIIYSLIMMNNSFIAPNINFNKPDEESARLNLITKTTEHKIDTFLSNSFGFGGTNSTLIISKYKK